MSRIVVCEKTGNWARLIGRLSFVDRVVETRSLDDCLTAIQSHPGSIAAVEVEPGACQRTAEWICGVPENYHQTTLVVMIPPAMHELGWCLRQAGAVHVINSPLELRKSKGLIKRHLSRIRELPLSLDERIWNNLPWSRT